MKIVKMFDKEFALVEDDEAKNIARLWHENPSLPIDLRNGEPINPKAILRITSIPKKQYYNKQPLINGEYINGVYGRYYLEPEDRQNIKICYDPKYFDFELIEAKDDKALPEVSKFAKKVKIKGMSGSKFNQNSDVLLNKNNNYGK